MLHGTVLHCVACVWIGMGWVSTWLVPLAVYTAKSLKCGRLPEEFTLGLITEREREIERCRQVGGHTGGQWGSPICIRPRFRKSENDHDPLFVSVYLHPLN